MKIRSNGLYGFLAGLLVAAVAGMLFFVGGGLENGTDPDPTATTRRSAPTERASQPTQPSQPSSSSTTTNFPSTTIQGNTITDIYDEYPIKVKCNGDLYKEGSGFSSKLVGQCEVYDGPFFVSLNSTEFQDCIDDPERVYWPGQDKYFICKSAG